VCDAVVDAGESCTAAHTECAAGFTCSNGTCVAVAPRVGVGQDCTANECIGELYCNPGTRLCAQFPTSGQSCQYSYVCDAQDYCDSNTHICTPRLDLGDACGSDAGHMQTCGCVNGLYCNPLMTPPTCAAFPKLGEPCAVDPVTHKAYGALFCADGLRCDFNSTPPTCTALFGKGEVCAVTSDCVDGRRCLCPDATTTCTTLHCVDIRFANESCVNPADVCHPGFACTNGACVPRDSQGRAAACQQ